MYHHNTVPNVRKQLASNLQAGNFVTDKSGVKMLEIQSASFIANDTTIFGLVNEDYVERELAWYKSQSLNVNDIPGGPPKIWQDVSSKTGLINSNYGWAIYSEKNGNQYRNVVNELVKNPESRRAIMIYTRPAMHKDYNKGGMSDFMCTNAVQYLWRNAKLDAIVTMRSNDAIFGYKNDLAWQQHVLDELCNDTGMQPGKIYWNAGSFHVYESHFYLVDHYLNTFETNIKKADYKIQYPDSPWQ